MKAALRFFGTIVLAALLIIVVYLVVAWLVDGYFGGNIFPDQAEPDAWSAPDSWSEWRDIAVVAFGLLIAFVGLLACILLIALIAVALSVRRAVNQKLLPLLDSTRDLVDEVRGTAEFVGESAVTPIIRVYSVVSGIRRGLDSPRLPRRPLPGRVMSSPGPSDEPLIGEGDGPEVSAEEMAEQLRAAAQEAITVAREGAQQKEEELWARYRELTKGRRPQRKR